MILSTICWLALGLAPISMATPMSPLVVDPRALKPLNELAVRDPMLASRDQYLEKRLSADFSLEQEWHNEELFGGVWSDEGENDSGEVSLSITCRECWTKGNVNARLTTGELFKPPVVRLDFEGVEAYVNLGVETSAGATYSVNLFTSQSPLGLGFPGLHVGMVFYVDLVFSVSAHIDMTGGFYMSLADDAYLDTDIFSGAVTDSFFDGISTREIPIEVHAGSATFKAALRLRVQCGAEASLDVFGIGAGAVVGIYANLIQFNTVLEKTDECALEARGWFDLNVGAYARLNVVIDWKTMGAVPTVSTTLFESPTLSTCFLDEGPEPTEAFITATLLDPSSAGVPGPRSSPTGFESSGAEPTSEDFGALITSSAVDDMPISSSIILPSSSTLTPIVKLPVDKFPVNNSSVPVPQPSSSSFAAVEDDTISSDVGLVTSTVYSTREYTITKCAANVFNCPVEWEQEIIVTKTVDSFTTVCPPGEDVVFPTKNAEPEVPDVVDVTVVTDVVQLTRCATPVVETFVPPTSIKPPKNHWVTGHVASEDIMGIPSAAAYPGFSPDHDEDEDDDEAAKPKVPGGNSTAHGFEGAGIFAEVSSPVKLPEEPVVTPAAQKPSEQDEDLEETPVTAGAAVAWDSTVTRSALLTAGLAIGAVVAFV